jgi:hypothetical protein
MAGYEYLGAAVTLTLEAAIAEAVEGRLDQPEDYEREVVSDYEQDLDAVGRAARKKVPPYLQDYRDVDLGLDSDD